MPYYKILSIQPSIPLAVIEMMIIFAQDFREKFDFKICDRCARVHKSGN